MAGTASLTNSRKNISKAVFYPKTVHWSVAVIFQTPTGARMSHKNKKHMKKLSQNLKEAEFSITHTVWLTITAKIYKELFYKSLWMCVNSSSSK